MTTTCLAQGGSVDPVPHPTFLGGKAWTCPSCGRTFSEAHPTMNPGCPRPQPDSLGGVPPAQPGGAAA